MTFVGMGSDDTEKGETNKGKRKFRRIGSSFEDNQKARGLLFSDTDPKAVSCDRPLCVIEI